MVSLPVHVADRRSLTREFLLKRQPKRTGHDHDDPAAVVDRGVATRQSPSPSPLCASLKGPTSEVVVASVRSLRSFPYHRHSDGKSKRLRSRRPQFIPSHGTDPPPRVAAVTAAPFPCGGCADGRRRRGSRGRLRRWRAAGRRRPTDVASFFEPIAADDASAHSGASLLLWECRRSSARRTGDAAAHDGAKGTPLLAGGGALLVSKCKALIRQTLTTNEV